MYILSKSLTKRLNRESLMEADTIMVQPYSRFQDLLMIRGPIHIYSYIRLSCKDSVIFGAWYWKILSYNGVAGRFYMISSYEGLAIFEQ